MNPKMRLRNLPLILMSILQVNAVVKRKNEPKSPLNHLATIMKKKKMKMRLMHLQLNKFANSLASPMSTSNSPKVTIKI